LCKHLCTCLKIQNESKPCSCGFGDGEGKIYSITTDVNNTLEVRMNRIGMY